MFINFGPWLRSARRFSVCLLPVAGVFLACNTVAMASTIIVRAAGDMGTEQFQLQIDDQTVATFDVQTEFFEYQYQSASDIGADQIRLLYSGDLYDPENGVDTNLNVDWIDVDGILIETESPFVYSTATWRPEDGILPGYGRGETLHSDGYFQFAWGSTVLIQASGDEGIEQFRLELDRESVATYSVTTTADTFSYAAVGLIDANQVRVVFQGDIYDETNGIDTNLNVDWIEIDGVRTQTENPSVFSTGTWTIEDGIVDGFGRGETLHTDGYFQYSALQLADDRFSIPEDSISVPIAVLANDRSSLDTGFKLFNLTDPSHGTLEFVDGTIFYTPDIDFSGSDSFTYTVAAGDFESRPITVDLDVNPSHEQPQSLLDANIATELTPSGRFLEVEKLVRLPLGANDRQPRMNNMAFAGERVFVVADGDVDNEGEIYELVTVAGVKKVRLFLDVGVVAPKNTGRSLDNTSPQGGLRSVAFHPDFAENGKFYTSIMEERPADPSQHVYLSDDEDPVDVDSVVVEWTFSHKRGVVLSNSYREVFRVGMPVYDHPIKAITFNPYANRGDDDYGLLYVGHGDGSVQSAIAGDGQNNDALGKVLRINPLQDGAGSYSIPASNPFRFSPNMIGEAYAIGFRNPHNLTFARDAVGEVHLIVTEIGRDNIEEINVVVAGGNYGWANREGPFLHAGDSTGGINIGITGLPANEANNGYIFPAALMGHNGVIGDTFVANAIAGGHVIQNGSTQLDDQFVFVEFATDGRAYHVDFSEMLQQVTSLDPNDPLRDSPSALTWMTPQELTILFDHDNDDGTLPLARGSLKDVLDDEPDFEEIISAGKTRADLRLGQGPQGELYILNKRNGWIYIATNTVAATQKRKVEASR